MTLAPLGPDQLRRRLDPASFGFETTAEVEPLEGTIGQPRALRALEFGLAIETAGYNVFATGPIGTGKRTTLEAHLRRYAGERSAPDDWLYLFDFRQTDRPIALKLPPGAGPQFAERMRGFVEQTRRRIPEAFESDSYQQRRQELAEEIEHRRDEVLSELRKFAAERSLALELTPAGLATIPVIEGKPIPPAEFRRLSAPLRKQFQERLEEVESRVPPALTRLRQIEREGNEQIRELDREVAMFAIGHLVDDLKGEYREAEKVEDWLERVREDVIEHLRSFRGESEEEGVPEPLAAGMRQARESFFARYEPNVFVSSEDGGGAPVVFETNPTYYNLFGRVEYEASFGALSTDHRHIKAGALHRANGGYLMIDALNALAQPFVWTKLKETLRTGRAQIETIGSQLTLFPTATLEPEPIDLDLKVILVGPHHVYALLYALDEDVRKLFKVRADFNVDMPWKDEAASEYASFIARLVAEGGGLLHFDRGAVARVVEQGARVAADRERLSTRFIEVADLVAESSHWASQSGADLVRADHVERAIEEKVYRSNLIEERIRDAIAENTLMIDVTGERIGQVNGLSVSLLGDYEFGRPVRITASTGLGGGDVVNIDRESELAGPIQAKGFMILAGYLNQLYGRERPLSLQGSIVFEQNYDEIEGDSASCAELFALLSSLAEAPVRQGVAVTGSVNQHGRVQAIGGVNEKVEGFFAVCKEAGLDGSQGVIIPEANVKHLMLRETLVDAVNNGRFTIWAIETVDDGVEVLTGIPAGERDADGSFPERTIHRRIEDRLDHLAELAQQFGGERGGAGRRRTE